MRVKAHVTLLLVFCWGVVASCGGSAIPFSASDAAPEVGGPQPPLDVPAETTAPEVDVYVPPDEVAAPACSTHEECDDGDSCTADRCDASSGDCVHAPIRGCCTTCCESDEDCDDDRVCTVDSCVDGGCRYDGAGCCETADDCLDSHTETQDLCIDTFCVYALARAPRYCDRPVDCTDGGHYTNPCVDMACVAGRCSYTPNPNALPTDSCCLGVPDCDDGDVCTDDNCTHFRCIPTLSNEPRPQVAESFDDGPPGMTFTAPSGDGVGWHVTDARFSSPPSSMYFGELVGGGYAGHGALSGSAVLGPAEPPVSGALILRFRSFADIDDAVDEVRVEVIRSTAPPVVVWSSLAGDVERFHDWTSEEVDLVPYRSPSMTVSFVFYSNGATAGVPEGWFVDDVSISYICRW